MADIIALPALRFDERQIEIMRRTIAKEVPPEDFAFFLEVALSRGLNPFNREIYPVMRGGRLLIQTGIDGFRKLADGSMLYRGQEGPFFCGKDGIWLDAWIVDEPPVAARIGVLREGFGNPTWAVARYKSYVQKDRQGNVTETWLKMPEVMLAKCAEALALRKAFPAQLAGMYVHEEMMQADTPTAPTSKSRAATLMNLYTKGQNAGLWSDADTFYAFCGDVLDRQVTRETGKSVTSEERLRIDATIDAEIAKLHPVVVEAEKQDDGYIPMDQISQELPAQRQQTA